MQLQRHPANPILLPDPASDWETYNVLNPSVIYHAGLFHMHYRAQGLDWISRIGYAVSPDGVHWNRMRRPVLQPQDAWDDRGIEDPRLTEIEGMFYMAYTAYGSQPGIPGAATHAGGGVLPMIARSSNLITWERLGPIVTGEDNKDHVLFPRRIQGRYVAFHRRPPQVWLAESEDLIHWPEEYMRPIFGPRAENGWDSFRVGGGGVPVATEHGWLAIYHAYDPAHTYRLGVCLLDLENPAIVLHRPEGFVLEPRELWELRGDVPNVVFSCANPVVGDKVYVFYGGADHVIGLATIGFDELLEYARFG
ncbi:MAG TPA: glycosidase [Anaerolineales bacterium]|nr:glycosidase [Anaerolineales bacterium]